MSSDFSAGLGWNFNSASRLEASLRDSDSRYESKLYENKVAVDKEEETFVQDMTSHRSNLEQMVKDDMFKSASDLEAMRDEVRKLQQIESALKRTVLDFWWSEKMILIWT